MYLNILAICTLGGWPQKASEKTVRVSKRDKPTAASPTVYKSMARDLLNWQTATTICEIPNDWSPTRKPRLRPIDFTTSMFLEVTAKLDFEKQTFSWKAKRVPHLMPRLICVKLYPKILEKEFITECRNSVYPPNTEIPFFSIVTIFPAIFSQPWSCELHHSGPLWKQQLTMVLEHEEIRWTRLTPIVPHHNLTNFRTESFACNWKSHAVLHQS